MPVNDNVIEVKDLHRTYISTKGFIRRKKEIIRAVNGISFSVKKTEIFGLLGQNGAGKTTTIKMLITLLAPTSGECKVLGFDTFGEEKKIRNRINFIFGGEMGVYRRLSGRDNLRYFSNLYHIDPELSVKRVKELLEMVELSDKADLLAETYSKGMIQRLQIARGLVNDPEIVFMDEPTVGFDPLGARMLREIIRTLKAKGKTVLLTTHYMPEAEELCDRLAVIDKGRFSSCGLLTDGMHFVLNLSVFILMILTGANFPISLLPAAARTASRLLPLTRSIEAADMLFQDFNASAFIWLLSGEVLAGVVYCTLGYAVIRFAERAAIKTPHWSCFNPF